MEEKSDPAKFLICSDPHQGRKERIGDDRFWLLIDWHSTEVAAPNLDTYCFLTTKISGVVLQDATKIVDILI